MKRLVGASALLATVVAVTLNTASAAGVAVTTARLDGESQAEPMALVYDDFSPDVANLNGVAPDLVLTPGTWTAEAAGTWSTNGGSAGVAAPANPARLTVDAGAGIVDVKARMTNNALTLVGTYSAGFALHEGPAGQIRVLAVCTKVLVLPVSCNVQLKRNGVSLATSAVTLLGGTTIDLRARSTAGSITVFNGATTVIAATPIGDATIEAQTHIGLLSEGTTTWRWNEVVAVRA